MTIIEQLAKEFSVAESKVEATVGLIDEGNTIPFIARYRKEVTGGLDDALLRDLNDRLTSLRNLEAKKQEVSELITAQEKMTPEIQAQIDAAKTVTEVDDIYRPFRPHRKTRADVAREKGLEPLSQLMLEQRKKYEPSLEETANDYVDEEKGVATAEDALQGAMDIIAEGVSDNADFRKEVRKLTFEKGFLTTKAAKEEDSVYAMYYDYSEPLSKVASHRVLAINRGEKEEFLKVKVDIVPEIPVNYLLSQMLTEEQSPAAQYVRLAVEDSYQRLIAPSIEREIRNDIFDVASEGAIKLFGDNLSHLLMQSPLKGKTVLGFDPGYGHGCKLAVVDKTGKVLDTAVIFPFRSKGDFEKDRHNNDIVRSSATVKQLIVRHKVDVVSIGNGTASKESELFIAELLKSIKEQPCKYIVVSEAGASIYSASKLATEEFPDFDVMQRSAVSIARRLQDPLAELIKIDPKGIGVGQYQHDMKQARLDEALDGVVEDCVNAVGVDVNTASYALLSHISGINITSAKNIVKYREENGEFSDINQLKKVPRIGDKAFQQAAGFLRIPGGKEILDNTGVHPESYSATEKLLAMFDYTKADVKEGNAGDLADKVKAYGADKVAAQLAIGVPTLHDILDELKKPGRDIRDSLPAPELREDVMGIEDLKPDMELTGTVRNVIDFGAFVDIGVHQDGLVHISQLADKFVKHPADVVKVGDVVKVRVLSVDLNKQRISLTMKSKQQ